MSGGGARQASTFCGLMSISRRSIWIDCFTKVEELIGKAQIRLAKKIMSDNLQEEARLSPMNTEVNRKKVTLCMDGGWDQRASGKAYNSASGRVVSARGKTKKVCHLIYYSKRCSKCEAKKEHPTELCANPEKYDRSSKAMEALGSVQTVLNLWNNFSNLYCGAIVTDEDGTTRSKLSHSMQEQLDAKLISEEDRRYPPTKEGCLGAKKSDLWVLPLEHPKMDHLSDPLHYVKSYKTELYTLAYSKKAHSETCKADAMRLSRNLAYMVAECTPGTGQGELTFEKFQKAGEASFEHHWNNHLHCGSWCQPKKWSAEEREKNKHKYRDKLKNPKEYSQQMKVKEKYLDPKRMRRMYHEYGNNKTEQIHGFIVNTFLPKRSYFCRTICGRARTNLAVSIDSLGYNKYYKILYLEIGIEMSGITELFFVQHDRKRDKDALYSANPERRKKRGRLRLESINKEWKREVLDKLKGNTYKSRMMAPKVNETTNKATKASCDNENRPFCNACQNYGHQRISSKRCFKNPTHPKYKGTCAEIILHFYCESSSM